jgi:hypothetical protein
LGYTFLMPLTANDRIILVRIKIERAKKHLRDLAAELLVATNVKKTVIVGNGDRGFSQGIPNNFLTLPRMSFDVVVIAGEVVHSLRSALDHLAWQLVEVAGNMPTSDTMFPIAKDINAYESSKIGKVKGMRSEAVKAIDALKPYKGGNDLLWRIHELDIIDKHRHLFSVAHDYLFYGDWFDGDYLFKASAPNFSGVFDAQVEEDMQLEIDKAISQTQVAQSNSLLPSLHQLMDFVDKLVADFKPLLE